MSTQEICIIVIPNDFPKENDEDGHAEQTTPQVCFEFFFLCKTSFQISVIILYTMENISGIILVLPHRNTFVKLERE
jgi:hypothetical protein